jgi:hypothetical protein
MELFEILNWQPLGEGLRLMHLLMIAFVVFIYGMEANVE